MNTRKPHHLHQKVYAGSVGDLRFFKDRRGWLFVKNLFGATSAHESIQLSDLIEQAEAKGFSLKDHCDQIHSVNGQAQFAVTCGDDTEGSVILTWYSRATEEQMKVYDDWVRKRDAHASENLKMDTERRLAFLRKEAESLGYVVLHQDHDLDSLCTIPKARPAKSKDSHTMQ